MTAVAQPPNVHPVPRSWNGAQDLHSMTSEIFMPRSKGSQRYSSQSSSSVSSLDNSSSMANGGWVTSLGGKKKGTSRASGTANGNGTVGWPKTDLNHARTNGVGSITSQTPSTVNGIHQPGPILPSQHLMNGPLTQNGQPQPSFLMLLPLNATFERKQIPLPFFPETLRIGRQTNNKTIPTQTNGFFDSKVLSRQHAEVWADKHTGKVWIRDIKSSNGTFVNSQRLSQENQDSEPHELRTEDVLELGIDIVGEDNKTIVHHKVAARVEHAGAHVGNFELNFNDIDPLINGPLMGPPNSHGSAQNSARGRNGSQSSRGSVTNGNGAAGPGHRQQPIMMAPVSMEMVVKRLNHELYAAKQQSQDLQRTAETFDILLSAVPAAEHKSEEKPLSNNVPLTNGTHEPSRPPFTIPQAQPTTDLSRADSPDISSGGRSANTVELDPPNGCYPRIQDLEEALKREKQAREEAEDRAALLEKSSRLLRSGNSREPSLTREHLAPENVVSSHSQEETNNDDDDDKDHPERIIDSAALAAAESANALQHRMEEILAELEVAKSELQTYKLRAEAAEQERDTDKKTLMDTIRDIRKAEAERALRARERGSQTDDITTSDEGVQVAVGGRRASVPPPSGIIRADSGLASVPGLSKEQALLLRKQSGAPYGAVLGVVIFGVGLMVAINTWQRGDR
ncbi:hypothetical protein BDD12DRAFT_886361 [Trichophaea hybrida]|nr:hypothetical protein BDD12DRAFT_886361 [Trichophaea hybrida]